MSLLGTFGVLSLLIFFYTLAKLSGRFGAVTQMRSMCRYYYLSIAFILISSVTHIFAVTAYLMPKDTPNWFSDPLFLLLAHHLPLTVGVTIGLIVTWYYWSWLFIERDI